VLGDARHAGLQRRVRDLNLAYASEPALWEADSDSAGFAWIDCNDHESSIVSLVRKANGPTGQQADGLTGQQGNAFTVAIVNFTPVVRYEYRVGVPESGTYVERLNSDAEVYGGSNVGNQGRVKTEAIPAHGYAQSLSLTVPPLGFVLLKTNN
jgi:1,4-alpha-glucan branching enzyme